MKFDGYDICFTIINDSRWDSPVVYHLYDKKNAIELARKIESLVITPESTEEQKKASITLVRSYDWDAEYQSDFDMCGNVWIHGFEGINRRFYESAKCVSFADSRWAHSEVESERFLHLYNLYGQIIEGEFDPARKEILEDLMDDLTGEDRHKNE